MVSVIVVIRSRVGSIEVMVIAPAVCQMVAAVISTWVIVTSMVVSCLLGLLSLRIWFYHPGHYCYHDASF